MQDAARASTSRSRRSPRVTRVLQLLLALWVGFSVWLLGFRTDGEAVPVLPDTAQQFSLDLEVVATFDHDVVYAVEQRARPAYRIFSLDPSSGQVETVFTVPEDAIIYGLALSNDERSLAVTYSPDFSEPGNGLWVLDLESGDFEQISEVAPEIYLTEPEWSPDGALVFTTRIDRTGESEVLDIASVAIDGGAVTTVVVDGIGPLSTDDGLYFLTVDQDKARRSIGVVGSDGHIDELAVGDGALDLDHLVLGTDEVTLRVAGIEAEDDSAITIGEPAEAHGNHDVPSTWWEVVDNGDGEVSEPTGVDPIIVYDASSRSGPIVYATLEGLSIAEGDTRVDLIESRAIRFVAS